MQRLCQAKPFVVAGATPCEQACNLGSAAYSGIEFAAHSPETFRRSLVHAQPKFDASCRRGICARPVSPPRPLRICGALRHLDGSFSADTLSADSSRTI